MMKNLKRNWLVVSKLTQGIWQILTLELESLKNLHFNGLILTKLYVWVKKNTEELCLIALKIDTKSEGKLACVFKNLYFNRLLLNKVYVWARKSIGEFCLMALNVDVTFEGKLTCAFKNDMTNLANFHQSMFESLNIGSRENT